jgi:hypothetical protein
VMVVHQLLKLAVAEQRRDVIQDGSQDSVG